MTPIKLQDKAVLVILNCSFSWGTITDKEITEETTQAKGSARGALRVRKTLLPNGAGVHVEAVRKELNGFYGYHSDKTYATPIKNQRIMPAAWHMDYMQKFSDHDSRGKGALKQLVDNYDASIQKAKALLGDGFNLDDYPPKEDIPTYYNMNVKFLPVPSGDAILNALGRGAAADVDVFLKEMQQSAAKDAEERLMEAVKRMATTLLTPKGRIFDTMPESLNTLVQELPVIAGLSGSSNLKKMVQTIKDELSGYSGEDFRKDDGVRTAVGKQALEILKKFQVQA